MSSRHKVMDLAIKGAEGGMNATTAIKKDTGGIIKRTPIGTKPSPTPVISVAGIVASITPPKTEHGALLPSRGLTLNFDSKYLITMAVNVLAVVRP